MQPRKHEGTKKTKYLLSSVSSVSTVVVSLMFYVAVAAQQPARPTFRTSTQLIVETVTVKDKDGKPIEGLTAKDFTITEDGEPQMISFVEFQRVEAAAAAPAPS